MGTFWPEKSFRKTCLAISLASAIGTPALADDAASACAAFAGAPSAETPISREASDSYFSKLARARPHCEAAIVGPDPDPNAIYHIAVMMQREAAHDYAKNFFELAAQKGVPAAHTKLADYFNFGIGDTPQDLERAVSEYSKAMDMGDIPAKSTMAIMHSIGRGVERNSQKMLALLTESADAGYHVSQMRLAELYLKPRAVPPSMARDLNLPDPIMAARYFKMAADQGSSEAALRLAQLYEGSGEFSDPDIKLKLLQHAAKDGDATALNALGFMYERAEGASYDPLEAARHYILALEAGLDVNRLRGRENGYVPRWDRETALEFQRYLKDRGLYLGGLDAQIGPGTLAAARRLAAQ